MTSCVRANVIEFIEDVLKRLEERKIGITKFNDAKTEEPFRYSLVYLVVYNYGAPFNGVDF